MTGKKYDLFRDSFKEYYHHEIIPSQNCLTFLPSPVPFAQVIAVTKFGMCAYNGRFKKMTISHPLDKAVW